MTAAVIVFGGTFDPVHIGHLAVARQALQATAAPAAWFVLTDVPPLRDPAEAPADARYAMLVAATQHEAGFVPVDIELRRGGVSYTVDTMAELHATHTGVELVLLLGADAARSISRWQRHEELLARERFLIINRSGTRPLDGAELQRLGFPRERTQRLEVESPDVSASEIRRRLARGEGVDGLVPPAVLDIIRRDHLYAPRRAVHNAGG